MTIAAATTTSTWLWYFGRATGLVALVLLTAVVVLGILGPLRVTSQRWPRYAIRTVHRDASLLTMLVIVIHVLVLVLDSDVHTPLSAAVLPWGSAATPFWTGLGAVAFDLLIAIVVTSLMRRRLGFRTWRLVHWFTYVSWPVAVAHGLGAGSDSGSAWSLAITVACILITAVAVLARIPGGVAADDFDSGPAAPEQTVGAPEQTAGVSAGV